MKRFIIQSLVFLTSLLIIDRACIIFRVDEKNIFNEITIVKLKCVAVKLNAAETSAIIIVGSSHAEFGISPEILSKSFNQSAINLAYGNGANIGLQLSILRKLISRNKIPQVIIFGMDVFTLNNAPVHTDEFQHILFNEPAYIQGWRENKFFYSYLKLYSRFIPRYIEQIKKGNYTLPVFQNISYYNLSMFNKYEKYEVTNSGWVKGYASPNMNYIKYATLDFIPDKHGENELDEYINLCKKNNIEIVFVQIPEYIGCLKFKKKYDDFESWINNYVSVHNCIYINYNDPEKFPLDNDSLFFDTDHLNKTGAVLFSNKLSEELKRKINWE